MELTSEKIRISETIYDGFAEKAIESDFIVPDYFPDILRIVRISAVPRLKGKIVGIDKLSMEGVLEFKILYMPESDREIRCLSYTVNFEHVFEVKNIDSNSFIKIRLKIDNGICRVINPRKINPKAILFIAAKVTSQKDCKAVGANGNEEIEVKSKDFSIYTPIASADKNLKLSEDLEIGGGMPNIKSLLTSDVEIMNTEVKLISNKAITRGYAKIKSLYYSENDTIENMESEIPFTQIIDLDGVDESCNCDIKYDISDYACVLRENEDGENRILSVDIESETNAKVFKNENVTLITDAYSLNFESKTETKQLSFEKMLDSIRDISSGRNSIDFEEEIDVVADLKLIPNVTSVQLEGKSLVIEGNLDALIFAIKADNKEPISMEKTLPFKYFAELKDTCEKMRFEPEVIAQSVSFTLVSENRIDIRYELSINTTIFGTEEHMVVTNIAIDEQRQKEKRNSPTVVLYFAKSGEKVWDIAKQYNTSQNSIKLANNAEFDEIEKDQMLIIPRKKY